MAIKDSNYEGSFAIPTPKGVWQAAGDTNVNVEYAYRAENMRTERGLLATSYGTSRAFPSLGASIETLTRFYRRSRPDDPEVYVAAAGGGIYTYTIGTEGWVKRADGFQGDKWSCITYEAVRNNQNIDVLVMSNALDGMVAVYGDDLSAERKELAIGTDYKNVKFAQLGRHAERIWGTGATGYPDSVFYSKPYDPFDWTSVPETPELGGGEIKQPTWDGDSFVALVPFGGYLLAFKQNTIFEIRGTDPSSFTITQGYGTDGPVQAHTICTDRLQTLFLAQGGLGVYDGSSMRLLAKDALYETMRMRTNMQTATACVCDHVYYLALCVKKDPGDIITQNNAVIEYDTERGTFMLRTGIRVKDFFTVDGVIYYTQADAPYDVLNYNDPEATGYLGQPIASVWETAWLDLGKRYDKSGFELRFTADADVNDVPLDIEIITEKRAKKKTVLLQSRRKEYRVKIQTRGQRVKLRLSSNKKAAGWRIYGGVRVDYEMDEV